MLLDTILESCKEKNASDIHITVDEVPWYRQDGKLIEMKNMAKISEEQVKKIFDECILDRQDLREIFEKNKQVDMAYTTEKGTRLRVNVYTQQKKCAFAFRILRGETPTFKSLDVPKVFYDIAEFGAGMVIITGPTGSGKSTTLAAIINYINENRRCHILTLEDPIEYVHKSKRSFVTQREIGEDSLSYPESLRAALREDPDVILIGEMRDLDSIAIAIQAAETGHLVFSTLHTMGAAKTIDRIIDVFPAAQQQQIRIQLSGVLKAVVSQKLVKLSNGGGRFAIHEIMIVNSAISAQICSGKTSGINDAIQTSRDAGMISLDSSLASAVKNGNLSKEDAFAATNDIASLKQQLEGIQ